MNIAFDSHKRYTFCSVADDDGNIIREARIEHQPGAITDFLREYPAGEAVAVETIGNWYWIVDEIEAAGMQPLLVHARKAKLMMGCINKTDRLDARGLNRLQRAGTLPTVWIPPGELRDQRDLTRTRMYLVATRTRLKNRIHSSLDKYGLVLTGVSDIFGKRCRKRLVALISRLPVHARFTVEGQLSYIDELDHSIKELNKRIERVFEQTEEIRLLRTMPGVASVLSVIISLEVGDISRFQSAGGLASYSGTVPRVCSSGGRTSFGRQRPDVNRYLKWAFAEAANSIVINQKVYPERQVIQLYRRIRHKRGHAKAIGAVSRHLAEATFHMLTKKEPYKDPILKRSLPTKV